MNQNSFIDVKFYIEWSALSVYSMNPSLYRAGRAWILDRSFSRKRRWPRELFGHLNEISEDESSGKG